jgi:hypothetical protein
MSVSIQWWTRWSTDYITAAVILYYFRGEGSCRVSWSRLRGDGVRSLQEGHLRHVASVWGNVLHPRLVHGPRVVPVQCDRYTGAPVTPFQSKRFNIQNATVRLSYCWPSTATSQLTTQVSHVLRTATYRSRTQPLYDT